MHGPAEILFQQLKNVSAIKGLIGQSEDSHFDCKEWPSTDEESQKKMFAKAACGLTNADGGVLVIGMKAESRRKDEPDIVTAMAPVSDTAFVKSRVLNLIGNLVEPGIVGVRAREVKESQGSRSGFVIVYLPASEGAPRRSKKDWKFYRRIGNGTFPMEYGQIEDMFGKRPNARLELSLEHAKFGPSGFDQRMHRIFRLGLKNVGRGLAKFPSIRFQRACGLIPVMTGIDGNCSTGLPIHASEGEWIIFRGGIDSVIFPDEVLQITMLGQVGSTSGNSGPVLRQDHWANRQIEWKFSKLEFSCEIACEGAIPIVARQTLEAESCPKFD